MNDPTEIRILSAGDDCPTLDLVEGEGAKARALLWPGVGAHLRTFHRLDLPAGTRSRPQRHPESEAVYYVVGGNAEVWDEVGGSQPLREGSMVHIDPETRYVFVAGEMGAQIVGGPCPADPALYIGVAAPGVQEA